MAEDMGIKPYTNEIGESYEYRVIYSALGLWCLTSALSEKENRKEISKNAQSILMHRLVEKYTQLCPSANRFLHGSKNLDIAFHIRNLYEQTGYLLTMDNNYNVLNDGAETIRVSQEKSIYLGLPSIEYTVNGLGIHCKGTKREINLNEFLKRDNLTPEKYLIANYDECDFESKDIKEGELEFFNPLYRGKLSESWQKKMNVDMTIARKSLMGPYYRVLKDGMGQLLFADEINSGESDSMIGAEFRRTYIALKKHYMEPMQSIVCPIDDEYSHIRILGQLPNREYFYLLLNGWPKNSFSDRYNFIIRNELIMQTIEILSNIGFTIRNGEFYG